METSESVEEAVDVLQQLGLKEYEARCFVGLTRLETGTAKRLSELTEVPRTRVYDAIRVLEAQGLVEVHHSSPQRFRAVPLEEAMGTLRDQYEDRVERLRDTLEPLGALDEGEESPVQEVWSMTGGEAIANRMIQLVEAADSEVVLVLGDESLLTGELVDALHALDDDVELMIGTVTETLRDHVRDAVPQATTFVSGLEWLHAVDADPDETAIGRLLMVDRSSILVSTITYDGAEERAIFGEGFRNGLVVMARRMMAQGLIPARDPG